MSNKFTKLGETSYSYKLQDDEYNFIMGKIKEIDGDIEYEGYVTYEVFLLLLSRYIGRIFMQSEFATQIKNSGFVTVDVSFLDTIETISFGEVMITKDVKRMVSGVLHT